MKKLFGHFSTIVILLAPFCLHGQNDKDAIMGHLSALVGGKWIAEGQWSNGQPFKQELIYEWGLGRTIVKVKTFGAVDETRTFGLRNEGIRAWDKTDGVMRFWEFDVFGGITEGTCGVEGKSFYYQYEYDTGNGLKTLTDMWTRIDGDTYGYKVGFLKNSKWESLFLETTFKRTKE